VHRIYNLINTYRFSYADALQQIQVQSKSTLEAMTVTMHDRIYVIYEKDHANTGPKPDHDVTAAYS